MSGTKEPYKLESKYYLYDKNLFSLFLSPFVFVKKQIENLYFWLLSVIFAEVIQNRRDSDIQVTIPAFICFIIFSLLLYHFKMLKTIIFVLFAAFYLLEFLIAKLHFLFVKKRFSVALQSTDLSHFNYYKYRHSSVDEMTFKIDDIDKLIIKRLKISGSAFESNYCFIWELQIRFNDLEKIVIYQNKNINSVWKQAVHLSDLLDKQIIVIDAINANDCEYVYQDRVNVVSKETYTQLESNLSANTFSYYLRESFNQMGALLFVVIASAFMARCGFFMVNRIGPMLGYFPENHVHFHFTFENCLKIFLPDLGGYLKIGFALLLVIFDFIILHKKRIFRIYHNLLTYKEPLKKRKNLYFDNDLHYFLFEEPDYSVIIFNNENSIEIKGLKDIETAKAWYSALEDNIDKHSYSSFS